MQVPGCRYPKNMRRSIANMASENYLEEVLNAKVDETEVNAIKKTLEIHLNSLQSISCERGNPVTVCNEFGKTESQITSRIQHHVANKSYCAAANAAESSPTSSVISFQKPIHSNDQRITVSGLSTAPVNLDSSLTHLKSKAGQCDGSTMKVSENLKPTSRTEINTSNCRPMFQNRPLPNTNLGFSFSSHEIVQATIADNDSIKTHSLFQSPVMVNVSNFSMVENKLENKISSMIRCSTPSNATSNSPRLINIVTVPITTQNSMKVPDTNATTINSSRMVGTVTIPKFMAQFAGAQQLEESNTNHISSNNFQVLNAIPLKQDVFKQQGEMKSVQRMMVGNPQMMENSESQVKMPVQPLQGQDAKPSQGHLLIKNQNGQYQWVRVIRAPSRSASGIALTNTTTSNVAGQSIITLYSGNPADLSVGTQLPTQTNQNVNVQSISSDLVTKEKCQTFLGKILQMANEKTGNVKRKIYTLTQDLIDGKVDVECFANYIDVLLNTKSQFYFTEVLTKSLPLIRHSLATKEFVLDGIRPPPYYVSLTASSPMTVVSEMSSPSPVSSSAVPQSTQQSILIQPSSETSSSFKSRVLYQKASVPLPTTITQNNVNKSLGISQVNTMDSSNSNNNIGVINPTCFGQLCDKPQVSAVKPLSSLIMDSQPSLSVSDLQKVPISTTISNTIQQLSPTVNLQQVSAGAVEELCNPVTENEPNITVPFSSLETSMKPTKTDIYSFTDSAKKEISAVTSTCKTHLEDKTQNIINSRDSTETQNKINRDKIFLNIGALGNRIKQILIIHGLKEPSTQVATLISQACEVNIKNLLEKLSVIAAHRTTKLNLNSQHEVFQDVKRQLKFLEEVEKVRKRHEGENESKYENCGTKFKGKHKNSITAETAELRQQETNQTALQAIGFRKRTKYVNEASISNSEIVGNQHFESQGQTMISNWPRIKRVTMQDMIFLLEQEKHTCHSLTLYKAYFKR